MRTVVNYWPVCRIDWMLDRLCDVRFALIECGHDVVPWLRIHRGRRVAQHCSELFDLPAGKLAGWIISLACMKREGDASNIHGMALMFDQEQIIFAGE